MGYNDGLRNSKQRPRSAPNSTFATALTKLTDDEIDELVRLSERMLADPSANRSSNNSPWEHMSVDEIVAAIRSELKYCKNQ